MDRFPALYTDRLILRKLQVEDVPALVKYANNKNISDWIVNIPYPYQEPNAVFRISYVVQGFKAKSRFVFAIIHRDTQELIGEISLHLHPQESYAELGYWIAEPFWNQGFATEAIGAVLAFGFDRLALDLIHASCHTTNVASGKVLQKNGMQAQAETGKVVRYDLNRSDYHTALTRI